MQGFAVPAVVMLGVALSFPAAGRAQDGDAAKGKQIFARCQVCHSLEADTNKLGPSLHGIIGRPAASVEGFTYSDAMKESGLTWDDATLGESLASPQNGRAHGRTPVTNAHLV